MTKTPIIYSPLSRIFQSRSGGFYLYEAFENKFYYLPEGYKTLRTSFDFNENSPISQFQLPFTVERISYLKKNQLSNLILCLTEACNLRCSYCSYSGQFANRRIHSNKIISESTGKQAIDWLYANSVDVKNTTVIFYGGEPLLCNSLLITLCQYARERKPEHLQLTFQIVTNGVLIDEYFCEWFSSQNDVHLQVTLNGPAEIHDRARRIGSGEPSHEKIIYNLTQLYAKSRNDCKDRVQYICNFEYWYELNVQMDWFKNKSFIEKYPETIRKIVNVNNSKPSNCITEVENQYIDHCLNPSAKSSWLEKLWDEQMKRIHYRDKNRLCENAILPINCIPLGRMAFVSTEGNIYLCEKADGSMSFGNVVTGADNNKLNKVLHNIKEYLSLKCCNCWAIRFCRLCIKDMFDAKGDIPSDLASKCNQSRKTIVRNLSLYSSILEKKPDAFDRL